MTEGPFGGLHHPGRAAQVHVVIRDVRDEPAEALRIERISGSRPARAKQVVDTGAPRSGKRLDLLAEDDVGLVADPVQQGHVAVPGRQGLEQGAQRRDADAAGEQEDLGPAASGARQDTVRPSMKTFVPILS